SAAFPRESFEPPQKLLLEVLETQGIAFSAVHVDASTAAAPSPGRKPGIGMLMEYLRGGVMDFERSAVVGDRETDVELARNLGVRGFRIGPGNDWPTIARAIVGGTRVARVARDTAETRIRVDVDLDREAPATIATGLGFFDHMLAQLARHGGFALTLRCEGDLHVDEHHVVEDCAIALGEALARALGDKRGIARYGHSAPDGAANAPLPNPPLHSQGRETNSETAPDVSSPADAGEGREGCSTTFTFALPMDEARAEALLDLSGRPFAVFTGKFQRDIVGDLPTELVPHFFRSLADGLRATVHVGVTGENTHHMVEACFKAFARALRMAVRREGTLLPSTKEAL
ncbi:MAG TPA: HAD hydrolase-like protein, partial [Xanthomonadales bacterium]|nr:HAD hydrolase-like protein [Xanthomonadales bacterium]